MSRETQLNIEPEKLTKKDITRSWFLWWLGAAMCTSVERLQALGFCASMTPVLEKLYKTKESLSEALKRHLLFFNTQGIWGSIIHGSVIALEEKKAHGADIPDEAITGLKSGLMGPMAGIGDTLDWVTLGPILLSLFLPFAMEGNWFGGAIMPLALFTIPTMAVSYYLWHAGYDVGQEAISRILEGGKITQVITGASVLGLFMMGAISASFVKISTPIVFTVGAQEFPLQSIFDRLFPGFLPLVVVVASYVYLQRAGQKTTQLLLWLIGIGLVLGFLGVL